MKWPAALLAAVLCVGLLGFRCPLSGLEPPCVTPEISVVTSTETFLMGGDPACKENGQNQCGNSFGADDGDRTVPEHLVNLSPFSMDQTEVSNLQYRECVDHGVCKPPLDCVPFAPFVSVLSKATPVGGCRYEVRQFDGLPVVAVTWEDAKAYCEFRGKTLPTEAQWERAAVGPRRQGEVARKFAWGDENNILDRAGTVSEDRCDGALKDRPRAVRDAQRVDGQSAEGVYDLSGNVREWTLDDFDPSFYCDDVNNRGTPRPTRFNDCAGGTGDGGVLSDCVRSTNAPAPPTTILDPAALGSSPRKVVRGGAFCSTNTSQVQHECDLLTRARMGLHKRFQTPDVPGGPLPSAGWYPDAQLTGFRCVRNGNAAATEDNTCPRLELRLRVYVPGGSSSSGSSSGGGPSSSSSAAASSST